jgi:SAM-dependent methyltransferase
MPGEQFQPIAVKPPSANPLAFRLRCVVDLQLRSIAKFLRPAASRLQGHVLDVGAGESPWKDWLPGNCSYHAIDVPNSDEFGMTSGRNDGLIYFDGRNIPFPASTFDGVLCIEVLEHAKDPEPLLADIARVMKPEGLLLLTVPWSARCHHRPHDYHRFTKEQLGILLSRTGFVAIEILERGSDVGAIANKLTVLALRMLKPSFKPDKLITMPLGVGVAAVAAIALLSAHVCDWLGKGSKDDPLGYFVMARSGFEP